MSVALEQVKQIIDTLDAEERANVRAYLESKGAGEIFQAKAVEGKGGLSDPAWLAYRKIGQQIAALPKNVASATQLVSDMRR